MVMELQMRTSKKFRNLIPTSLCHMITVYGLSQPSIRRNMVNPREKFSCPVLSCLDTYILSPVKPQMRYMYYVVVKLIFSFKSSIVSQL